MVERLARSRFEMSDEGENELATDAVEINSASRRGIMTLE
jgi:hypothetical protein